MPQNTQTYKLDYFKQGSYYSALSDLRRFVTMDYNIDSYVGIIGVGIISGWTIESVSGLIVKILPGQGIINGYFAESPYTVKQRSDMVAGDREIEVLNENDTTELPLTPAQRAQYVAVVQLYDPSFNPVGDIENSYVKVVVPTQITLSDNTDTYIYAQRPTGATPYPLLADYPPPAGNPPNRADYNNYDDYEAQLIIYDAKLAAIHNYEWYTNPANHFTAVDFVTSSSLIQLSTKVLLGRVVTRGGVVSKIDVSAVDNIANLESQIRQVATEYLVEHRHGGNKYFDPPKVKLETDLRTTSLWNYNLSDGTIVYSILEREPTSITIGHKHTYKIDADGNGQTIDRIGSTNLHFHKIASSVVGNPEYTTESVETHIHTIPSASNASSWTSSSSFIVYLNDSVFGDETTPYIHIDADTQSITFDKGVSASNSKYATSFSVTLENPDTAQPETLNYSYEGRDASIYRFMLTMIADFNSRFARYFVETTYETERGTVSNIGIVAANIRNSPFIFYDGTDIVGLQDLFNQSSAAQSLLQKEGDQFTFTPNAAKNITVSLIEVGHVDQITVEFLGKTEVTGKLKAENILYINANKILTGEFSAQVIPFVSHVGRMREECFPLQYAMTSSDGIRYYVVPTITDISLGHYHKLLVNKQTSGATTDLMIANDVIYYQSDDNNNTYFIYHAHGVDSGAVFSSESNGLLNWQNNVASANLTSSVHTHNVIYPVIGNEKTIYAIKEDVSGNIYVGTSDGFMIIPQDPAYQFVVNGLEFYFYGNDLWSVLDQVKLQYEAETGDPLVITTAIYGSQIANASLVNVGDSALLTGTPYPDRATDSIMIKRVSSFQMPDFRYIATKQASEVLPTETIIETNSSGSVVTVTVERNFNDVPIWSIELDTNISASQNYISSEVSTDVIVTGSNIVAKSIGLNKTPYQPWTSIDLPFAVNVMRKTIKDPDDNYWACTNNGVLVSRYYSAGNIFEFASLPGGNPDVQDILNGERSVIYSASSSGIFKTTDGGKTWLKLLDVIGGFKQITRDRTLDKSTVVNGHYHEFDVDNSGNGFLGESIGSGTKHVHLVANWNVADTMGHTHTMVVTIYAVDNNKVIWKSVDNGTNWTQYGLLPDGECGEICAAFSSLFVSQQGGTYKSPNGTTWSQILSNKAYSYEWSYDMSELLIGSDNILYGTFDGTAFSVVYSFSGKPSPILISNGVQQYFGHAYSNASQSFHFKNLILSTNELAALVDFEKWYAQQGGWSNSDPYDIYINYKRVLSTKYNEDMRDTLGYDFTVTPLDGSLDFSATTQLSKPVAIYDFTIEVVSSDGFSVGDLITVMSNNSASYFTITSISGNIFTLDSPSSQVMLIPSSVKKIPALDGQSNILINVYDSLLSNIGNLTHDQVEDGLSNYSDGRPYKFNDTYLSNLLQLTQATRYVYPTINSEFINDMFYDFRYSWSPTDPIYPYIYDYIDVLTSSIYNEKVYDSNFVGKWAKSINKILIGFGSFSGHIIVATEVGVFIAELTPSFEANWFYINDLPYAAYDLMIYGSTRLYVATSNGTYYSEDLKTWTLESSLTVSYPSYSLGLRWSEQSTVIVYSHTAEFVPNTVTNIGTITASSGTPYKNIRVNQGIKITGAGAKNGNYIVERVKDGGTGYGSQILVTPSFALPSETISGVVINMGTWWERWNGDVNTSNVNIKNTLLIGGENHISYNDGSSAWFESSFDNASNFISRKFLPLSNGRALLAATGTNESAQKNYLLKSDDIGKVWDIFREFESVKGSIFDVGISDFDNTVLKVNYTQPHDYVYINGILDQQDIAVYAPDSTIALFHGKVVWNEKKDSTDTITVYGNTLESIIGSHTDYVFVVSPIKVNSMIESTKETLFFGTDKGLYYDVNTVVGNVYPEGTVTNAGINGVVEKIDIGGSIISLSTDSVTNNTILSLVTDTVIRGEELIGKYLYVTDTDPVEKYPIIANTSFAPGAEFALEISVQQELSSAYIGKKIRIIGNQSRAYINFDLPVLDNQFNGGTIYVSSNEYGNRGEHYGIVSNTDTYVDLNVLLSPSTTLVPSNATTTTTPTTTTTSTTTLANTASTTTTTTPVPFAVISAADSLQVGQNVRLIDSSDKLTLWITLSEDAKENSLQGLEFELVESALPNNATSVTISSNLKNSVTLDTNGILNYSKGDTFVIKGAVFEQLGGFSHLQTSIDSDHYHAANTVNAVVTGSISSFSNNNASCVDINVTDTTNFNIPLVQYRGDLFEDAQIVFTNPQAVNLRYISEVVSHTSASIKVRIKSASYWDFTAANLSKISSGWQWEIDGTDYGYTNGITYDDFVVLTAGITATAASGANQLKIESTTGINVGDRIRIQDDTLSFEINTVGSIVDATTIQLSGTLDRTYFITNNPQIKVLRDSFANTHIHQIRNNEVEPLSISAYLDNGYSSQHSHRILPLIADVSVLLNQNDDITVFGSSSIIYKSSDNGLTWQEVVDLNDFLEGSPEISGISSAILYNDKLVVGATNGNLFAQTDTKDGIISLNSPL